MPGEFGRRQLQWGAASFRVTTDLQAADSLGGIPLDLGALAVAALRQSGHWHGFSPGFRCRTSALAASSSGFGGLTRMSVKRGLY
jgi:hypothetical protein